eukprot:2059123-Amphidinium_carterae.2
MSEAPGAPTAGKPGRPRPETAGKANAPGSAKAPWQGEGRTTPSRANQCVSESNHSAPVQVAN